MNGVFTDEDLETAINMTKNLPDDLVNLSKNLIRRRSL
jgi:hypothetical protein